MTQPNQTQPAQPSATPEKQGMFKRGFESVRSMPWVMGTEMAAQQKPSRGKLLGVASAAVVAVVPSPGGESVAYSQEPVAPVDPAADARECLDSAVDRQHSVYFSRPLKMRTAKSANFRISDWSVKLSGTRPDVLTACDNYGGRTIKTWMSMRAIEPKSKPKRVTNIETVVKDSNADVHDNVSLKLKPNRFRGYDKGTKFKYYVNVRESGNYSGSKKSATTKAARGTVKK
jgi:hypothetical protein